MIQQKKKSCKKCSREEYLFARGMCKQCAYKNPKVKTKLHTQEVVKTKPTGELALFKSIWDSRPHICSVCKTKLYEFSVWFFSHILSKGAFPRFRLYDKNIILKCKDCHHDWEVLPKDKLLTKNTNWGYFIELHDKLEEEYYAGNNKN